MIRSARRTPRGPAHNHKRTSRPVGTSTPSPDGRSSIYFRLATRVPAAWGVRVDARDVIRRNRRAVPVLACVDRARVPAAAWRRAGRPPRRRKRWGRAQGTGRLGKRIKRYFRCGLPVRTGLSVVCTLSRRGSIHGGTRIFIVTCPPVGLQCAWFARARARHRSVTVSSVVCRARGARHPGHSVSNQGMRKGCKSRY
jgi:hypothetical protein